MIVACNSLIQAKWQVCLIAVILLNHILFSCNPVPEKASPSTLVAALDSLIVAEHDAGRFSGAIVVGNRDSICFLKAIGTADRVWDIPMQADYRFDIASINKSFISALILNAVEEGQLRLDDRLTDLLQHYSYNGQFDPGISLHHLLTHTSGLPDYSAIGDDLAADDFIKFKRLHVTNSGYVDFISRLKPLFPPGDDFHYSNFAYHLLAIILEDRYQKTFQEILEENICIPLNLSRTFSPRHNQEVHRKVVEAYRLDQQTGQWIRNNFIDLTLGRRIFSTVEDLYRWAKAMDDSTILSSRSLDLMKTNHLSGITDEISYGYGWVVFEGQQTYRMGRLPAETPYIIHGGSTEGYKSMLINVQEGKWIIAFLSNIGNMTDEMALATEILNLLNKISDEN
jgi:CubicO group peptidase (beta-lactamase class C family)